LTKSENIGKKTNQSCLLNSFLFIQIETGAAAKNIEICPIAIENDLADLDVFMQWRLIKSIGKSIGVWCTSIANTLCKSIGIGNTLSAKYWYCYWQYFSQVSLTSLS